jgi:hypothetical protein
VGDKDIGVLYLSLQSHLKKKFGYKPISKKDFFALLGRHFLIPKSLRIIILKEMEQRKLIEMVDGDNDRQIYIRVSGVLVNLEEQASKFYKKMGFY